MRGAVQGVGFRPFVYRLARALELGGFVSNDLSGVTVEVEGPKDQLRVFAERLLAEPPPLSAPEITAEQRIAPLGETRFEIRASGTRGPKRATVLPDAATCADCAREVLDPANRRYRYPFTNCTNCGPRFSIIRNLPYDRPNTSMQGFVMCPECRTEYTDPGNRRFHAQPNACPRCGPSLSLEDATGRVLARRHAAVEQAARAVREGRILALKGLGGFHLMVDALSARAVERLRERKGRWEKPLALMVPELASARSVGELSATAERLLTSPEAPILLVRRRPTARVTAAVAPGNPYLGIMLPYTPLHHLLMTELGSPVVATSGNLSEEPICIDDQEARERLGTIADVFLMHDRPIVRQVDDSVAMVVGERPMFVRRSRGYAPRPITSPQPLPTVLALGAQLKCTIALSLGEEVFLSQHVGDLSTAEAADAHERVIQDFLRMYQAVPVAIAHDLHPDYHGTIWAENLGARRGPEPWQALAQARLVGVQHHHAHLAACLADNRVAGRALGITWDGTGHGTDGTVWGGEFLLGDAREYRRFAHLRPFRLPGGEASVRQPRRALLGLLWELGGEELCSLAAPLFAPDELKVMLGLLRRGVNAPITTSAGRLFDAVAALIGLRARAAFEGQAAMELEFLADPATTGAYPMPLRAPERAGLPHQLDWGPLVEALLADRQRGAGPSALSARFHAALVEGMATVATAAGEPRVALSGGCFQNRLLTEGAEARLARAGFQVLVHRQVPCNDGGVSLGQVMVAAAQIQ